MKKTIIICITAIICVAIFSVPFYKDLQNKMAAKTYENAYTLKTESDKQDLPYEHYRVLNSTGAYSLMLDEKTGDLYNVYFNGEGDIRIFKGSITQYKAADQNILTKQTTNSNNSLSLDEVRKKMAAKQ